MSCFQHIKADSYILSLNSLKTTTVSNYFTSHISYYPNPFHEHITVSSNDYNRINHVRIHNLNGQVVKDLQHVNSAEATLQTSFPAGIYTIEIGMSDGTQTVRKVIKK